jgi:hypothetical protein
MQQYKRILLYTWKLRGRKNDFQCLEIKHLYDVRLPCARNVFFSINFFKSCWFPVQNWFLIESCSSCTMGRCNYACFIEFMYFPPCWGFLYIVLCQRAIYSTAELFDFTKFLAMISTYFLFTSFVMNSKLSKGAESI